MFGCYATSAVQSHCKHILCYIDQCKIKSLFQAFLAFMKASFIEVVQWLLIALRRPGVEVKDKKAHCSFSLGLCQRPAFDCSIALIICGLSVAFTLHFV